MHAVWEGQRYLCKFVKDSLIDDYLIRYDDLQYKNPIEHLSPREREVLQLIVEGKSTAVIAERLSLSPNTIDTYRSRLMQKLGITDLPGLAKFAICHGLTTS